MAMTLVTLSRTLVFGGKVTQNPDLTTAAETIAISKAQTYTDGTAANQANQTWGDSHELVGTSITLDLTASLTDAFNNTITFTKIKELLIANTSIVSGETLTLTGNFGDTAFAAGGTFSHIVPPNGIFLVSNPIDGYTVTDPTADKITINSGTDTITYHIWILGVI